MSTLVFFLLATLSTADVCNEMVDTNSFGLYFDGTTNLKSTSQKDAHQLKSTFSFWIKGTYAAGGTTVLSLGSTGGGATQSTFRIILDASRSIGVSSEINNNAVWGVFTKNQLIDESIWRHIVLAVDTTQSKENDRCKIWIDSVLQVHKTGGTYPTQNYASSPFGSTASGSVNRIGSGSDRAQPYNYFKGWLAQIVRVDGMALAPTAFVDVSGKSSHQKYIETLNVGRRGFVLAFDTAWIEGNRKVTKVIETHSSFDVVIPSDATSVTITLMCSTPTLSRTNGLIEFKNAANEIIYRGPYATEYCDVSSDLNFNKRITTFTKSLTSISTSEAIGTVADGTKVDLSLATTLKLYAFCV